MADTLDIALRATKAQSSNEGNGTALEARSNYGAAKDDLTHLQLWLSVDHGIEMSWKGQADAVERLDRGRSGRWAWRASNGRSWDDWRRLGVWSRVNGLRRFWMHS